MYEVLYIRTQYDGRDLRSVEAIFHYDESGEEQELDDLTDLCIDITTCADQGTDLWPWLKSQVELRLNNAGVSYSEVAFSDDEAAMGV
ncbi:hypothetical protein V8057_004254 [Vibrio vulnificus]